MINRTSSSAIAERQHCRVG